MHSRVAPHALTLRVAACREAQRKRQLAGAVEHLRAQGMRVARKVVEACARELGDLGLLNDVKKALV